MPWSDLSEVTASLTRLLERYIEQVLNTALNVNVVATPPDRVGTSATNTLSLYLYHVRETAETQNRLGPGNDIPNVPTVPMGLDLFYVLTAHQHTDTTFDASVEQRLMGYALKTFHDFPVVTDATVVAGLQIITGTQRGRENRLNIEFRKLEPDSSFAIWTTGERQFARLAAYYQVGLVMLDPEPPRRMPGTVLSIGSFVTPMNTVTLASSRSQMNFTLPAIAGGGMQTLFCEPARPAVTAPAGANAQFSIFGENLAGGIRRQLVLRNTRWAQQTPPVDRVAVDPALNAANGWTIAFRPDRIDVRIGAQLTFVPAGGGPNQTIDVFPGLYALRLDTILQELLVGGQLRSQSSTSNETAIAIAPRITGHVINVVANSVQVDLSPAFPADIVPPAGEELDIQVIIDGDVYARSNLAAPPVGEFAVLPSAVLVAVPFNVTVAGVHTLRLSIEGVDAQPYWIEIP